MAAKFEDRYHDETYTTSKAVEGRTIANVLHTYDINTHAIVGFRLVFTDGTEAAVSEQDGRVDFARSTGLYR